MSWRVLEAESNHPTVALRFVRRQPHVLMAFVFQACALPKGRTNNPNGRPRLGDAARVMFTARVAPATSDAIAAEADRREISRGVLLDEIVARTLFCKRKS